MKTRLSKLVKPILIIGAVMLCLSVNAGVIIPVPVIYNGSHSDISDKQLIGILIAFNIISLSIIIIRSLIWLIKRPGWTYVQYVWFSYGELFIPFFNTIIFIFVNGIAIISFLSEWISTLI